MWHVKCDRSQNWILHFVPQLQTHFSHSLPHLNHCQLSSSNCLKILKSFFSLYFIPQLQIHQQIILILPSKYVQNPTISNPLHYYHSYLNHCLTLRLWQLASNWTPLLPLFIFNLFWTNQNDPIETEVQSCHSPAQKCLKWHISRCMVLFPNALTSLTTYLLSSPHGLPCFLKYCLARSPRGPCTCLNILPPDNQLPQFSPVSN